MILKKYGLYCKFLRKDFKDSLKITCRLEWKRNIFKTALWLVYRCKIQIFSNVGHSPFVVSSGKHLSTMAWNSNSFWPLDNISKQLKNSSLRWLLLCDSICHLKPSRSIPQLFSRVDVILSLRKINFESDPPPHCSIYITIPLYCWISHGLSPIQSLSPDYILLDQIHDQRKKTLCICVHGSWS